MRRSDSLVYVNDWWHLKTHETILIWIIILLAVFAVPLVLMGTLVHSMLWLSALALVIFVFVKTSFLTEYTKHELDIVIHGNERSDNEFVQIFADAIFCDSIDLAINRAKTHQNGITRITGGYDMWATQFFGTIYFRTNAHAVAFRLQHSSDDDIEFPIKE